MKTQGTAWLLVVLPALLLFSWAGTAQGAPGPAEKCEAARNQTAGKYAYCRQNAEAKLIKTKGTCSLSPSTACYGDKDCEGSGGGPCNKDLTKYNEALGKCSAKFTDAWNKTSTKYGALYCHDPGYREPMNDFVTAHSTTTAASLKLGAALGSGSGWVPGPYPAIAPPLRTGQTQCDQGDETLGTCPGSPAGQDGALLKGEARQYVDNGDGTITDKKTGLMWEKLSDDGTVHDWNNTYTWEDAFTDKIATLNSGFGFAYYKDWRLPNVNELQTLADYGRAGPAIDPVFNTSCAPGCTVTTCSCTQADGYWSSTTYQFNPVYAWPVNLFDGSVGLSDKTFDFYARAVRGGL